MADNLMDIKEAAGYLKMNKMTIYKLAREGKMPAFRVASEWRFRRDLIDKWLMSQLKGKPVEEDLDIEEAAGPKSILIVDDEEAIRNFFSQMLSEYRILTAKSGEEALEVIKAERPELVLLDLKMPGGIDGLETLKRIRKADKDLAVVMLTAYGTPEVKGQATRLGAQGLMPKPFELPQIKAVIEDSLKKKVRV